MKVRDVLCSTRGDASFPIPNGEFGFPPIFSCVRICVQLNRSGIFPLISLFLFLFDYYILFSSDSISFLIAYASVFSLFAFNYTTKWKWSVSAGIRHIEANQMQGTILWSLREIARSAAIEHCGLSRTRHRAKECAAIANWIVFEHVRCWLLMRQWCDYCCMCFVYVDLNRQQRFGHQSIAAHPLLLWIEASTGAAIGKATEGASDGATGAATRRAHDTQKCNRKNKLAGAIPRRVSSLMRV